MTDTSTAAPSFWGRHATLRNLPNNSRFYIVCLSGLLSLLVLALLRANIANDRLYYIRAEQVFGYVALLFWYAALVVAPLQKVIGTPSWMQLVLYSRRALGVSAAYFALLHVGISLFGQLGGLGQIMLLPDRFKWSLGLGAIAATVLVVMALTSFDKAIDYLTFRRWKQIHRFSYLAGTLALVHVWMIGTHIGQFNLSLIAFVLLALLLGLESFRIGANIAKRYMMPLSERLTIFAVLWVLLSGVVYMVPQVISNYHSQNHDDHAAGDSHENH